MGRPPKQYSRWHGDGWTPIVVRVINARLDRIRPELAKILGLDEETEISAMIDDLSVELRRCWSILRNVNNALSDASVRLRLEELLGSPLM